MKNRLRNIKLIVTSLLIPSSVFLLLVGLVMIVYNENKEYMLGTVLVPLASLMFWYAIKQLIKMDRSFKKDLILTLKTQHPAIVHFFYSEREWNAFAEKNYQKKVKGYRITIWITAPFILTLLIILFNEDKEVFMVIGFMSLILITFTFLVMRHSLKEFKSKTIEQVHPEAKITHVGILLNNNFVISYHNKDGWLSRCEYEMYLDSACLNFKIRRPSGRGHSYQTFRVLIPEDREKEIDEMVERINESRVYKD
ncbi:MAG: hypothetical protein AAF551_09940 [Bacteroidota bacterium]